MLARQRPVSTALVGRALLVCAVALPGAALAGCGGGGDDGLPDDAIAKVGDHVVTKAQYADALKYQEMRVAQQVTNNTLFKDADPKPVSFAPPFTDCVQRATASVPAADRSKVPAADVEKACRNVPAVAKAEAVQQLISMQVLGEEGKAAKIQVTDAEIDKGLDEAYTREIGGKANLPKFEKLTGLDAGVFRSLMRQALTYEKLLDRAAKAAGPVTDADVRAYYDKNKAQFSQPESRELHVVLAKTEAEAQSARDELEGGATFASVVQKYGATAAAKKDDGKLTKVVKGGADKALEDAAFSISATQLAGPIQSQGGWYVVRVDKVTPPITISFAQAQATLKQQVEQTKPQEASARWESGVLKRWKAKTDCREGYNVVAFCKNQPKSATTTTGAAPAVGQ